MNILHVKWLPFNWRGSLSELDLYVNHDWCVIVQNRHNSHLSRHHFVRTFGHNLQSIGHILAFYIPNYLVTIGYIASWLKSCMRALAGELHFQKCIAIAFSSDFYTYLSNYEAYTNILHTKRLLYCNKHSFSTLQPCASSDWQTTFANTYQHLFLVQHFVQFCPNEAPFAFPYSIDNNATSASNSHKDFGIRMSMALNWSIHYNVLCSKACQMLGLLCCLFSTSCSVQTNELIYMTLVRSHFTLCSPIWWPHLLKDIKFLEHI